MFDHSNYTIVRKNAKLKDGTPLLDYVINRNKIIVNAFSKLANTHKFRLIGNAEKPNFIYENRLILNCFVRNRSIYFMDGKKLIMEREMKSQFFISDKFIERYISEVTQNTAYRIKYGELYLSGFFIVGKKDNIVFRIPQFAPDFPCIYTKMEIIHDVLDMIEKYDPDIAAKCTIVC